jgi:cyclopropane fatty-acyl-phospholipid synthase-like methyltransferase
LLGNIILSPLKKYLWKFVWELRARQEDVVASRGGIGTTHEDLRNSIDYIINAMELNANDKLLDVGCGVGYMAERLVPLVGEITAVDRSFGLVARAKSSLKKHSNVEVLQAEATSIPKPDGSFSKILCFSIIIYFPSRSYMKSFLGEMGRLLTEDGVALISDIPEKGRFGFDVLKEFSFAKKLYMIPMTLVLNYTLHTKFTRAEVVALADELGLSVKIQNQPSCLPFHASRFDALVRKN